MHTLIELYELCAKQNNHKEPALLRVGQHGPLVVSDGDHCMDRRNALVVHGGRSHPVLDWLSTSSMCSITHSVKQNVYIIIIRFVCESVLM